jgi:thiol:disulfide interchange protein DsbA
MPNHPQAFDPSRRRFQRLLLATLGAAILPARAAAPEWLAISPPQPGDTPGKIEVLEFFSYGCPHCRDFNPLVKSWAEHLPKDVVFRKVPVTFGRAAWENLARLFYALDEIGESKRLDQAVFEAIHAHHINLFSESDAENWVKQQSVDTLRFGDAFKSFSTETFLSRAEQLSRVFKIDSVPTLIVDGRYKVVGKPSAGFAGKLAVADDLLAQIRKERPQPPSHKHKHHG